MNKEETNAAIAAAHNELACLYSIGAIAVQSENGSSVDDVLWQMASKIALVSVRTAMHSDGTEGFYKIVVPKLVPLPQTD